MQKNKLTYHLILSILLACFFTSCNVPNDAKSKIIRPAIEITNPYATVDKSPMDISYYPVNYPLLKINGGDDTTKLTARLIYSRPQKNGRNIFGNDPPPKYVQQFGSFWRLGANEASEIEFFKPVNIKGQKILKGRYIIYCIPFENKWIVKLNSNLFSWGLHPDPLKDIAKIEIPVSKTDQSIEFFSMVFEQTANGADLIIAWDNIKASLPISF